MTQSLSTIKALLARQGIHPRKRFGQNFLHDQNKVREILDAAAIKPGDRVLEVGPGTGVLTQAMLERGASIIAVEIDRDMCCILRESIGVDHPDFTLLNCDVMDGKHALATEVVQAIGTEPFSVVANLPYNVASPLLVVLSIDFPQMQSAIVMVQKEVVQRITAEPGGKTYGPLSVMIQAMCETKWITTLSRHCFWPEPQIDSAVIQIQRRSQPLTTHTKKLAAMTQMLFTKRRKQIGSILGRDRALPNGIDNTQRPEQLRVQQIISLAESITIDE